MKKTFLRTLVILGIIASVAGCKKNDPVTPGQSSQRKFRISIANLPGIVTPRTDLNVLYSVKLDGNQTVLSNSTSTLQYDGAYFTLEARLPPGSYQLSSFLVYDANGRILFATPHQGSVKAAAVAMPLSIPFSLSSNLLTEVPVQVIPVQDADQPENFGYPAGAFDNLSNQNAMVKIRIHPVINIGGIMYDSIPASLTITTWDMQHQPSIVQTTLSAGVNEIFVPRPASKYKLKTTRWGITDEIEIEGNALSTGTIYTLGGSRPAKKLSSVITSKLVNGIYLPDTKEDFIYNSYGRLSQILNYKKDNNNISYLHNTVDLVYDQHLKVTRVTRSNATGDLMMEDRFNYGQDGKITRITRQEPGNHTFAEVQYIPMPGHYGLTNSYNIVVKQQFSLHYYEQYHNMAFEAGNMVSDALVSSHGNSEIGSYQYDFNINPFIHLQYPDLFFTHASRHNQLVSNKDFYPATPHAVVYDRQYSYDAEGYPTQLVQKYKTYTTGQFLYQTRTIFNY